MDHEGDIPPAFWSRSPETIKRRRPSSPTLNPVAMIILVPILALLVIAFILIPLLSNASQFLKTPNSLKKSWDSLNIVLVLFAILCGVFLRQNNDDASVSIAAETLNNPVTENISSSTSASQWFDDFNDQKMYNNSPARALETGSGKLMRSSSSYPDLRQHESLWQSRDRPYRFYDDFDLNIYHRSPPETDDSDNKVISVDTFVSSSPPPAGMTSAALPMSSESGPKPQQEDSPRQQRKDEPKDDSPHVPLQKPESVKMKRRRSVRNTSKRANIKRPSEIDHLNKIETNRSPPSPPPLAAAPPPPPPPPPPPLPQRQEKSEMLERKPLPPPPPPPPPRHQQKSEILQRKKSGATKEIATAIASLYNRTKKKKHKIRNIYENATTSPPPPNSSIPPPPPPPPPPSVFHNMFRKENKSKKIHSISSSVQSQPPPHTQPPNSIFNIFKNSSKSKRFNSTSIPAPPPPPPLPQSSILNNLYKPATTSKRFYSTSSSHSHHGKPPLPTKTNSYYGNIGSQSPVMPIPPPPPPPPFKMQQVKFKARGDFVRIKSGHGSRSSSPGLEDFEVASTRESPRAVNGEANMGSSVFCPSPDVNTKADNFIARLRDEWRLEKMNSIRAKQ